MSISSDNSKNMYCPPQSYGTRMIMVPGVRRQRSIFTLRCPQAGVDYSMNSPAIPLNIIRYNTPAQYKQIMQSYGVEPEKKPIEVLPNKVEDKETDINNPIDLSPSMNINSPSSSESVSKETESSSSEVALKSPKKEPSSPVESQKEEEEKDVRRSQRKRKSIFFQEEGLANGCDMEGWLGHVKPVPGIPRQAGSKREEVIKAARSLFSKRTRTLYHWLYPSTSKNKLKATVAAAWDTLSSTEKDFYVSQVLGRFGVPAGNLMVNPQLGGFKSLSGVNFKHTNFSADETGRAVNSLLLSQEDVAWSSYSQLQCDPQSKKRRRQNRNTTGECSSSRDTQPPQIEEEETLILKQIRDESLEDDFADDPELSKEFEQFRWALHVSNAPQK